VCVSAATVTYFATFSFRNVSEISPPETVKNADPAKPVQNRKMRCTAMLLASDQHSCERRARRTERDREVEQEEGDE
jgi:hypothetical protein